jgi:acyl-coenzyme A thioesterase PaaI-like protein
MSAPGDSTAPVVPKDYDIARLFDPFEVHCGPFFDQRRRGICKFAFRVDERHVNMAGVCLGGMMMTFADSAMGYTVWHVCGEVPSVTVSMQASFLTPAQIGDLVEVTPQITRRTRELVFLRGDFMIGEELAMTASAIWKLLG